MQGYTYFFLFLLQNIDCGYSLEPPPRGGSNVPTIYVLSKNKKNIKIFPVKIFIFTTKNQKLFCLSHGEFFRNATVLFFQSENMHVCFKICFTVWCERTFNEHVLVTLTSLTVWALVHYNKNISVNCIAHVLGFRSQFEKGR